MVGKFWATCTVTGYPLSMSKLAIVSKRHIFIKLLDLRKPVKCLLARIPKALLQKKFRLFDKKVIPLLRTTPLE